MSFPSPRRQSSRKMPAPPPYLSPPGETASFSLSEDGSLSPVRENCRTSEGLPKDTLRSPPASSRTPRTPRLPCTPTSRQLTPINFDLSQTSMTRDSPLFSRPQSEGNDAPLFGDGRREKCNFRNDDQEPVRKMASPTGLTFNSYLVAFQGPRNALDFWKASMAELSQIPGWGAKRNAPPPPVANNRLDANTARLEHSVRSPKETAIRRRGPSPAKTSPAERRTAKIYSSLESRKAPGPATVCRDPEAHSTVPHTRKRARPSKRVPLKMEDKDWGKLEDFSPPISTLDQPGAKPLKVTWERSPIDLNHDPEIEYMHPQEVEIAAALRLSGKRYLANKRRIFIAKVDSLRQGKDFNKTAAQLVCNIDVNKTSELWRAYERSGWFDRKHFKFFL